MRRAGRVSLGVVEGGAATGLRSGNLLEGAQCELIEGHEPRVLMAGFNYKVK